MGSSIGARGARLQRALERLEQPSAQRWVLLAAPLRFWLVGALLSLVPLGATLPSDRLLTLVGLGLMPVLATAIGDAFGAAQRSHGRATSTTLRQIYAGVLLFVHLIADPLMLPPLALSPAFADEPAEIADASLPDPASLRGQIAIVAQIPDSAILSYVPVMRAFRAEPRPDALYSLAAIDGEVVLERRARDALRLSTRHGFFDRRWESRSPELRFHPGYRVGLREMTIAIADVTPDGRPLVCDSTFSRPLESARYLWLTWRHGRLQELRLPELGSRVTLSTGNGRFIRAGRRDE